MQRSLFRNQGKNLFRKKANAVLFLSQKPGASRGSLANRNTLPTTFEFDQSKLQAIALPQS